MITTKKDGSARRGIEIDIADIRIMVMSAEEKIVFHIDRITTKERITFVDKQYLLDSIDHKCSLCESLAKLQTNLIFLTAIETEL